VLGPDVWLTINGYQRTLIPLYLSSAVALVGGLPERRAGRRAEPTRDPARPPLRLPPTAPDRRSHR
jgi:hypothetical protein